MANPKKNPKATALAKETQQAPQPQASAQPQTAPQAAGGSNIVAIITMFFLFAMVSFVTNMAAPVGTIWENNFPWAAMLGNMMNFAAYLFMGIPAGNMLVRYGYKKTTLTALAVGFVGLLLQWISSLMGTGAQVGALVVYLCGAFVAGFSVCILNTVVNPLLNIIGGGGNRGNQLVQAGASCNSLAGTLTPLLVGMLVGQVTKSTSMADVSPLLLIGLVIFLISFFIIMKVNLTEPKQPSADKSKRDAHSPWNFRHTVLGVVGIFFYVGMEVGIPAILIFYLTAHFSASANASVAGNAVALATAVAAVYWLLMLVGRVISSFISGKVSSRAQLMAVTLAGAALVVLAISLGDSATITVPAYSVEHGFTLAQAPIAALFLVLCGLCTSVMWGAIFNLAVEGLGKYTAKASGIFMMMVVGGGVLPLVMKWIADAGSYLGSYWIVVGVLGYLFFYAILGSRNVNKDIPVEDETVDPLDL